MSDLHCDTCRYFDARARECHVNPPTMHPNSPAGIWPSVDRFDWCGEHEARMELPIVTADDVARLRQEALQSLGPFKFPTAPGPHTQHSGVGQETVG